jgi:geranylgeranylglycerol-phosphate geranylgeranyltransferase
MGTALAVLRLVRWPNALIAATGVLVGAWWAGGDPLSTGPLLAAACAIALACLANASNDVHDRDLDRIAHPDRPIPSGALGVATARRVAALSALVALLLASTLDGTVLAATVVVVALMLAYTPWIKPHGLPGNVTAAVLASLPFLYGGWTVGRPAMTAILVALAIPLHLARELAKDLDDAAGDAGRRRTLPVAHGPRAARIALVSAFVAFLAVLASFVATRPHFAPFVVPAVALASAAVRRAMRGRPGAPALLKASMVCAMAALLAAR